MAFKKGRPTNRPGIKRVKLQTYTDPETREALERDARLHNTSAGGVIDLWFKERAGQNTRTLATIKNTKDEEPI